MAVNVEQQYQIVYHHRRGVKGWIERGEKGWLRYHRQGVKDIPRMNFALMLTRKTGKWMKFVQAFEKLKKS